MKNLKKKKNYNNLFLQFINSNNNNKSKLFLLKFILKAGNLRGHNSLVLKSFPYIYNLKNSLKISYVSNSGLNYIAILRYFYCFGINIKNYYV